MTMNAYVNPLAGYDAVFATSPLVDYIRGREFDRPTLVIHRETVARQYRALKSGLGRADIHYAVKANPAREVIEVLISEGSHFDAASRGEIELCLGLGAAPETISFGNTVKRASDIAFAHRSGITLFAADSEMELEKIAEHAPGAQVYIRLLVGATGADWPLSRKFGCAPERAVALMDYAVTLGLAPVGLSFHVGSQTRRAEMWRETLDMAEPGRGMVAEAGMIAAEVLLVSRKAEDDLCRWVYLDIGRFSGLAETEGEAIRYQFLSDRDHEATGPCILAGPSCDSADVLYEKRPVALPLGLRAGDRVIIRNCGAYTSSYSSVGFNGFPPLDVVVI
jgi:ornithine decarboxylase